jgi:ubiquinone/menaquinone biosynthesis C-methylase UbiE
MPLPLADKTSDLVTGFNSFQYAGNPVVALKEARRVSKPEGRIAIVMWGQPGRMEAAGAVTALHGGRSLAALTVDTARLAGWQIVDAS